MTVVTIMQDDFLKTNPGVKDLPRPGIEPQHPGPQSDATTICEEKCQKQWIDYMFLF